MRETRLPRFLSAVIGAGALGLAVVAGLQLGDGRLGDSRTGDGGEASFASAQRSPTPSPSVSAGVAGTRDSPSPKPTLTPLKRPAEPYPTPSFPTPPKKDAAELDRISYQLEKVAWSSAGYADGDTSTDCSVSDGDLVKTGTYDFSCDVSFDDVTTRFAVKAQVRSRKVYWDYSAKELPVSERKATYEVTRQSFKPARVTCSLVGLEAVRVGRKDALTCWVTTVDNEHATYRGELVPDGALIFRPES